MSLAFGSAPRMGISLRRTLTPSGRDPPVLGQWLSANGRGRMGCVAGLAGRSTAATSRCQSTAPTLSIRDVGQRATSLGDAEGGQLRVRRTGYRPAKLIAYPQASASTPTRGPRMRIERRYTQGRTVALRGHRVPPDDERDSQSRRLGGVPRRRRRGAGCLVAGRVRRAGAEIFPQGRRAGGAHEGRGGDDPLLAVALGCR